MINTKIDARYFFFTLLIVSGILTLIIIYPYLTIIVLAASVAVVLYPVHRRINALFKWQHGWLGALLTIALFIIVFLGPLTLIGIGVFNQSNALYANITNGSSNIYIANINTFIHHFLPSSLSFNLQDAIASLIAGVSAHVGSIFTATLTTIFSFLLFVLATFYFLKDGMNFRAAAIELSPMPDEDDEKVLVRLRDAITGVISGYFFIALIQGLLLGSAFLVFGIPNAVLFGVVVGIASFVPFGTAMVSIPAIIYLSAIGHTHAAIGYAIWAVIVIILVDNILSPVLIGHRVHLPPVFMLFAVIGGISLLGPLGILIGPLVVSLLYALVSIYRARSIPETEI